jgi:hypothetical protein
MLENETIAHREDLTQKALIPFTTVSRRASERMLFFVMAEDRKTKNLGVMYFTRPTTCSGCDSYYPDMSG